MRHHIVAYNGKTAVIDYCPDATREFSIAAMRIVDNGAEGHVLTPDGRIYFVGKNSRRSIRLHGAEREAALVQFRDIDRPETPL